jgi:phage shock protein A
MALITRVSRLFRADLHAVLDRIEEPDVLLRQAVREMEEELARDEQRIKTQTHEHGQLVSRHRDIMQSLEGIEAELDICFESGKDDLARALIRRKLEAEQFTRFLARKREAIETALTGLEERVDENRARLDSMRQKAELLAADNAPGHSDDSWTTPDTSVGNEDVEVAFLRERQKRGLS